MHHVILNYALKQAYLLRSERTIEKSQTEYFIFYVIFHQAMNSIYLFEERIYSKKIKSMIVRLASDLRSFYELERPILKLNEYLKRAG